MTTTRLLVLLSACAIPACYLGTDKEDIDIGTGGVDSTCLDLVAEMECEPGTTKLWSVAPSSYEYFNLDEIDLNGEYNGVTNGVALGGSGSSVVTQVINKEGCFAACVLDNPCDGVTPSLDDLLPDEDAEDGSPPADPPLACVVNPIGEYGLSFCYTCPPDDADLDPVEFQNACNDFALSCNGIDPDNPPPPDSGLDETGEDTDADSTDSGTTDDGAPDPDSTGAEEVHDCEEWQSLASGVNRDARGVVYLPEPLVYYAAQQDGLDMALCDDVQFSLDDDGLVVHEASSNAVLTRIGIEIGDKIVAFNGEPIVGVDAALAILSNAFYSGPIEDFKLRIRRRGREFVIPVYLR